MLFRRQVRPPAARPGRLTMYSGIVLGVTDTELIQNGRGEGVNEAQLSIGEDSCESDWQSRGRRLQCKVRTDRSASAS